MNVHIYDTHVTTISGEYYHFDVLVIDDTRHLAEEFANAYLEQLGVVSETIEIQKCNFCHSAIANQEVKQKLIKNGFYILPLEGC